MKLYKVELRSKFVSMIVSCVGYLNNSRCFWHFGDSIELNIPCTDRKKLWYGILYPLNKDHTEHPRKVRQIVKWRKCLKRGQFTGLSPHGAL